MGKSYIYKDGIKVPVWGGVKKSMKAPIFRVRGFGSLNTLVTYAGEVQPNLTYEDVGNIRHYSNSFDDLPPFNMIKEWTDSMDNIFIKIPPIYIKFYFESSKITGYDLSAEEFEGSTLISRFRNLVNGNAQPLYMGKYMADFSNKAHSVSGVTYDRNINLNTWRNLCSQNGLGYHAFDLQALMVIQLLMTTYFGTTNSRSYFPNITSETAINGTMNGVLNGYNKVTGTTSFLGIENIIGNALHWVDGIIVNDYQVFMTYDIRDYSSSSVDEYINIGNLPSGSDFIDEMTGDEQFGMIPLSNHGSSTTFFANFVDTFNSNYRAVAFGLSHNGNETEGLFYFDSTKSFTSTGSFPIGTRLMFTEL